ncbi:MAG: hypothetical protein H3C49_06505 [Alphaproteobacteria bacterium]|nr:hypothetical protein [Alphaproteobacteria bacterium]
MTINPHLRDIFNLRRDRSGFFPVAEDAVRVVSPAQALEVFDTLRAMQNISHDYTDDGCAQRTHLMCRALVDMKLAPEKGWAFETPKRDLVVDYPHVSQIWWFHVAPVLRVASEKGGAEPMAFDTVLFDGPATMKEWGGVMKAQPEQIHVLPCGKSPKGHYGDYRPGVRTGYASDAAAQKAMDKYIALENEDGFVRPQVFKSALRKKHEATSPDNPRPADRKKQPPAQGQNGPA